MKDLQDLELLVAMGTPLIAVQTKEKIDALRDWAKDRTVAAD